MRAGKAWIALALRMKWVKKLGGDIWEIRSRQSANIQRVCYFVASDGRYVITHGFTKKTQKTPKSEIERARRIGKVVEQEERHAHP
ncbi:type II toxin-antitoxin system RelE/ParE family toxin [Bifidobacterium simiarum]|uniref:type II toxin-antitoxin system RelE/ParE family toxin n=1 Tax=Bifidobacterium simiarum TaxID=2045441 RepID=UPI001BDD5260|nr:type II toxin-antitoxin system RelE/ParE family toxin [Bifidobacterium simiarum]